MVASSISVYVIQLSRDSEKRKKEEEHALWNTLLPDEPAFSLVRGSQNAMGANTSGRQKMEQSWKRFISCKTFVPEGAFRWYSYHSNQYLTIWKSQLISSKLKQVNNGEYSAFQSEPIGIRGDLGSLLLGQPLGLSHFWWESKNWFQIIAIVGWSFIMLNWKSDLLGV